MLREVAKRYLPKSVYRGLRSAVWRRRRRSIAMGYYSDHLKEIREWVRKDTESANFYYPLTDLNRSHLAHFVANLTGRSWNEVQGYFDEMDRDQQLRAHIRSALVTADYGKDIVVEYGRRIGWYAMARILRPRVIIETGVDHGVGSCVLTSALLRNSEDGFAGRYFGTEIRPEAGKLLSGAYATVGEVLYGDSIQSLKAFDQPIDLFINDSDHSADYEYEEYCVVGPKLSKSGIILSDNAHVSESLSRYSIQTNRAFAFFGEKPKGHWYPGAGIGASFTR